MQTNNYVSSTDLLVSILYDGCIEKPQSFSPSVFSNQPETNRSALGTPRNGPGSSCTQRPGPMLDTLSRTTIPQPTGAQKTVTPMYGSHGTYSCLSCTSYGHSHRGLGFCRRGARFALSCAKSPLPAAWNPERLPLLFPQPTVSRREQQPNRLIWPWSSRIWS